MNKNIIANILAFIIGIYFIVRAYFWYKNDTGDTQQNQYFAIAYLCVGILAIGLQIITNYRKKKKGK